MDRHQERIKNEAAREQTLFVNFRLPAHGLQKSSVHQETNFQGYPDRWGDLRRIERWWGPFLNVSVEADENSDYRDNELVHYTKKLTFRC